MMPYSSTPYSEEVLRLIFWQTPEEEGVGGNEIASCSFNIDDDFMHGALSPEYLERLRAILAKSPWKHDADYVDWCRWFREKEGVGQERFWWWPDRW